ncbi:MAG: ankyrin repeat domain-containing protein [Candidatus Phosphoribacter sp.]
MSEHDDELLAAAAAADLAGVRAALDRGANVDARDSGGRTALMTSSMRSRIPIMTALLDAGAGVNLRATLGETALTLAAGGRGGESITLLLYGGADPNLGDRDKKSPLMWLVDTQFHRGLDISGSIPALVAGGARVNDKDEAGRTALMWATRGTDPFDVRPAVLTSLVAHGADVEATDVNGETAMFSLVRYIDDVLDLRNGKRCIELLVAAGADRNAVNSLGQTPLDVVNPGNPLVMDMLRELGFGTSPECPS